MTHQIFLSSAAQRDIVGVVDWYEAQRPGLGLAWFQSLEEALAEAASAPLSCAPVTPDLRKVRLGRFPYVAVFAVVRDELRVLAVLGAGQNWAGILAQRQGSPEGL